MATDPQVKAKLSLDSSDYERNLTNAAKATDKVADSQDDLRTSTNGTRLAWAALGTAMTAIGAKMVGTLQQSIVAASDLNESASKTAVVFGESSDAIDDFAARSATSLGMSKRATYDAASMMALFGKSAGLAGDELVKFSADMVALSADLASFFNTAPEDAMAAIGSALRGEYESIRRYNVLIDDATLRQRALEMGIVSTTKNALTPQQKVLAAQAEILAQTSDAQGDFARTSDGLANSQRQMSAAIENAKASLGESLLPIAAKVAQVVAKLAEGFALLPAPIRAGVAGIGALLAGFALLSPAAALLVNSVKTLVEAYKAHKVAALASTAANEAFAASASKAGAASIIKGLGLVGVAIGAIAVTATAVKRNIDAWQDKAVRNMADAMGEAAASGRNFADAMELTLGGGRVVSGWEDMVSTMLTGSEVVKKQLVPAFDALDLYLTELPVGEAQGKFEKLSNVWVGMGGGMDELNGLLPEYTAKMGDGTEATEAAAAAAAEAAEKEKAHADAMQEIADKAEAAADAMWGYIDASVALGRAKDKLRGQAGRLSEAIAANGRSLDKSTEAGRKNREVVFSEIDAVVAHSKAVYENAIANGESIPAAMKKAKEALDKGTKGLEANAEKAGFAEGEVDKLIKKYAKIPDSINTDVTVTFKTANLAQVRGALNKVNANKALLYGGAASGGKVLGEGTATSDSNLVALSRGEWVIKASSAAKFGDKFMAALNSGQIQYAQPSGSIPTPSLGGGGEPIVVNLTLDGRTVQRSLVDVQRRTGRQLFPLN